MKNLQKGLIFALFIFIGYGASSQVVVYSEDFDGALTWTINTVEGAEDSNPNVWYISCEEEGVGSGACGAACGAGNQTLHIGADPVGGGDIGAAYLESGFALSGTNRRAESGDISTIGDVDLTLEFDMIGQGNATDFAEVFYSIDGGATWVSLEAPLTSLCCGGVPCTGVEQGLWFTKSYPLPATCEGIPNLRVSFVWQNVDDGIATDPSIAIDNLKITKDPVVVPGGPTALFDPEDVVICQGESITYTDMSISGGVITDWNWVFGGGSPASALTAGPHVITYNTPGVYNTTLTVTDGIGSHDTTFTVTVNDGPYAGEPVSIDVCEGDVTDLNTILIGEDAGGTWTETSAIPSGGFTPGTGVLDATGLGIGDVFTFEYESLPGAPPCPGTDVAIVTVTIIDCSGLVVVADFSTATTTICEGDCITFTDESTGPITNWAWTFTDPAIGGPILGADPGSICFDTPGDFDVTLTVSDGVTFDDMTMTIKVNPSPVVTATATPGTTICEGSEVRLNGAGASLYAWTGGVTNGVPFTPLASGSYTVTGTNNFDCSDEATIEITLIPCEPLIPGFEYDDNICTGDCLTLKDTSSGDPISWQWDILGGDPETSTEQNPVICFNEAGVYDIQLTVENAVGDIQSTTNSVTVFDSPTVVAEFDTIMDLGGLVNIFAIGSSDDGTYLWEPNVYLGCETCPTTTARPDQTTLYTVTFSDVNGCPAQDTVRVYVNFFEAVDVPDAFSPNGDGANDVLYVRGFGVETVNFMVFNKYGEKVFETRTQDIGWDGTFRGRDENPGVFTWVAEYTLVDGSRGKIKGNTTLVR